MSMPDAVSDFGRGSNEPPFDPLHPTPEEEADMLAGYMAADTGKKPDDASVAFEHGWRMRRNDIAGVVEDDQRELARRRREEIERRRSRDEE